MSVLKQIARGLLRKLGLELRRVAAQPPPSEPAADAFRDQALLLGHLQEPIVFDVGAHRGDTVKQYCDHLPGATVFAFEPHPESFRVLSKRFEEQSRVHSWNLALSEGESVRPFHVNQHHAAHSLLPRPKSGIKYYGQGADMVGAIDVESVSLDHFCAREGIESLAILKMDIQGGERMALTGAERMLAAGAISLIYTESMFVPHYEGGPLYHDLAAYLEARGYSLYGLYNFVYASNGQLRFGDSIFISPALRRDVDRLITRGER